MMIIVFWNSVIILSTYSMDPKIAVTTCTCSHFNHVVFAVIYIYKWSILVTSSLVGASTYLTCLHEQS